MYIYAPKFDVFSDKLSSLTGIEFSPSKNNSEAPSATLIVRINKKGGVDKAAPYITAPQKTLVIAGIDDERGMAFAEEALTLGVPEANIMFATAGQGINLQAIAERLQELIKPSNQEIEENNWEDGFTWDESPIINAPQVNRIKTVAIVGYRGGTGKTTVAMSLAVHFADIGEKVAVLDLGSPPAAFRYTSGETEEQDTFKIINSFCDIYIPIKPVWYITAESVAKVIEELRLKYRRVIIDYPAEPVPGHIEAVNADRTVVVVDPDIVQAVEPAAVLKGRAIFLYNKAIPETDTDLVTAFIGEPLVVIKNDHDGCQAALAAREPAYRKSEVVARGIGELAAEITR